MNVPTITMDEEVAGERADEYDSMGTTSEDATIAEGYRELAKGRGLLSLRAVFADVARDIKSRPRIAIARADRRQVRYEGWSGSDQFNTDWKSRQGRSLIDGVITIPLSTPLVRPTFVDGFALVPLIPAALRVRRDLRRHFILWEVERWADAEIGARPDRDPFLLKRIDEDLFAIVAQWDLTPLEQAIYARRVER